MAAGGTARRGLESVANGLRIAGFAIVAVLLAHIVLTLLDANPDNQLTTLVGLAAETFDLGLSDLFLPSDPKLAVLLNFGTAALIWYLITVVIVRLVHRMG